MSERLDRALTMDVARPRRLRLPRYAAQLGGALVLCALAAYALSALTRTHAGGAAVDRSLLVTDTVRRGTFVRTVAAQGAFRPDVVRIASATQSGVVDALFVKPGSRVTPGMPIARMENPALVAVAEGARAQLDVARANLASARQQARALQLTQRTALADAQAQAEQSALQARALGSLHASGLVPDLQFEQARIAAKKSAGDVTLSRAQLAVADSDAVAKVAAARAQVTQAAAQLAAAQADVAALTVRAAVAGIVQDVVVDPGSSVAQNTAIARVADTRSLKAVLQVPENDVRAVAVGMRARVDAGGGAAWGRVARLAPAAQNGTVAVDVTFARRVPNGARPDASFDAAIEIARTPSAVTLARPAAASDGATLELFKLIDGGTRAVRVPVRLGSGSSDRVQVLSGVSPGDVVIVSDTSAFSDQTEVRLR
jgi:HlyD family secretion protein